MVGSNEIGHEGLRPSQPQPQPQPRDTNRSEAECDSLSDEAVIVRNEPGARLPVFAVSPFS